MNTEEAKAEALRIAHAILDGRIELVSGCRAIQRPLDILHLRTDKEFITFVGVDSEADELPFGEQRKYWNRDVLRKKDVEIDQFISHYKPYVERACRKLIACFE